MGGQQYGSAGNQNAMNAYYQYGDGEGQVESDFINQPSNKRGGNIPMYDVNI